MWWRALVALAAAEASSSLDGVEVAGRAGAPLCGGDCGLCFLDMGANMGVQTRKVFEARNYSTFPGPHPPLWRLLNAHFGLDRGAWQRGCSVGFEPSPHLWPRLRELGARYAELGFKATFLRAGVGAEAARKCLADGRGERGKVVGCDASATAPTPVVDVADFLREHVAPGVVAVAKLDVEEAEYAILPRLLATRAHCLVSAWGVEWHRPSAADRAAVRSAWERATRPRNRTACSSSREMDDETFRLDPLPLPRRAGGAADDWSTKTVQSDGPFWIPEGDREAPPRGPPPWLGRSREKRRRDAERRRARPPPKEEDRSTNIVV